MNRAERRRNKLEKPKVYTLTDEQIKQIKQDAIDDATNKAFGAMLGLPLLALRDTFGFGKERLSRFMDDLINKYDSFERGYITLEDLINTAQEETGIKIEWRRKNDKG